MRYNANGTLDTTFGSSGKTFTRLSTFEDYAYSVTVLQDGKILLAEESPLRTGHPPSPLRATMPMAASIRVSARTGASAHSSITRGGSGQSMAVQADGKILVGGTAQSEMGSSFGIVRYNTDGTLDSVSARNGQAVVSVGSGGSGAYSITIQPDDKILLAGVSYTNGSGDTALARLNADGTLDTTFAPPTRSEAPSPIRRMPAPSFSTPMWCSPTRISRRAAAMPA